ncbi:tetraspanin [Plakobranchus ocellatus]|uniref:Tetraspanin n=1 Tax=Plakobranchus ocellatus TaxID=259542 RepID=A0AAV4B235_9GAST|nr:tetraspanin [Plakobranchus ocellatus]
MAEPRRRPVGRWMQPERSAVGACTKYTLFFENFVLVLVGLAMTAMGTYILAEKQKKITSAILFFLDPACVTCLAGGVITIMGLLGCTGALREITCFLKLYYYTLCIFLLVELGFAVAMFVAYYVPEVKDQVFPTDAFKAAIKGYRDDPDMQYLIDSMQKELGCCGYSDSDGGYRDWNENIYFQCSETNISPEKCSVPYSCCREISGDRINYQCGYNIEILQDDGSVRPNTERFSNIYTQGCLKALGTWIDDNSLMIGGIMLGILLPQVFIIVLTRNLIDMINLQKSKWNR